MGSRNRNPADYLYSAAKAMGDALWDAQRLAQESADLPEGCHKELPRRSEDDPMRRFVVDCPQCQGAGAGCPQCGDRGTIIVEVDADNMPEQ